MTATVAILIGIMIFFVFVAFIVWLAANPPSSSRGSSSSNRPSRPTRSPSRPVASPTYRPPSVSKLSQVRAQTIELAMHVAFARGALNKSSAMPIRSWAVRVVKKAPVVSSEAIKQELNTAISNSHGKISSGGPDLVSACSRLSAVATESQKDDAFKLCFEVAAVNGRPAGEGLKMLEQIVSLLDLDPVKYRRILGPSREARELAAELGIQDGISRTEIKAILDRVDRKWKPFKKPLSPEARELSSTLGIYDGMPEDDKHTVCDREYRKWHSRNKHPDPEKRARAERMQLLIGEIRQDDSVKRAKAKKMLLLLAELRQYYLA